MEKELEEWLRLHSFYKYSDYRTKDLAGFLNVSPRTIQRWIKGKTKPSKQKLALIGRFLSEKSTKNAL